jgi:hypothetical protein
VPEQPVRGSAAGGIAVAPQQAVQGKTDPVHQIVDVTHRSERVQPGTTRDEGDCQERAVAHHQLDQSCGAQLLGQDVHRDRRRQLTGGHRLAPAEVIPDLPLQRGLTVHEPGHRGTVLPATPQLIDAKNGTAQLGQRLGDDRFLRRPGRSLQQKSGRPAPLRPLEHLPRPTPLDGDPQAEIGQLSTMARSVRPDVRCAQNRAVLVQEPETGANRRTGGAAAADPGP